MNLKFCLFLAFITSWRFWCPLQVWNLFRLACRWFRCNVKFSFVKNFSSLLSKVTLILTVTVNLDMNHFQGLISKIAFSTAFIYGQNFPYFENFRLERSDLTPTLSKKIRKIYDIWEFWFEALLVSISAFSSNEN